VRRGCGIAKLKVERERIACEREARAKAQIGLVDVTGFDVVVHAPETFAIGAPIPFVSQRAAISAAPWLQLLATNLLWRVEDRKPQQRNLPVVTLQRHKALFQRVAELIGHPAGDMAACRQGRFDGPKSGWNLFH
jgi:hypothetical protein